MLTGQRAQPGLVAQLMHRVHVTPALSNPATGRIFVPKIG
jgi:hypothetical protein